jgi:hypothetical protein
VDHDSAEPIRAIGTERRLLVVCRGVDSFCGERGNDVVDTRLSACCSVVV